MTFACSDDIKGVIPHQNLLQEAVELSNGIKFGLSRLVVFQVSTHHMEQASDCFVQDSQLQVKFLHIPNIRVLALKFDRMSQSINEYMIHRVKIGAMGAIIVPANFTNRDFYQNFENLLCDASKNVVISNLELLPDPFKDLELLSVNDPQFDQNLDVKPVEPVAEPPKETTAPQPVAAAPKVAPPEPAKNPQGKQGSGNQQAKGSAKPADKTPKGTKPSQPTGTASPSKSTSTEASTAASTATTAAPKAEPIVAETPVLHPETTFRDLLREFCLGGLTKDQLLKHPLLLEKEELTRFVSERLWTFKPRVVLKYHNQNKHKCQLCSKPNLHECRVQSNTGHSLLDLDRLLRDTRETEGCISPVVLNLGVLVEDAHMKQALANRVLSNSYEGGANLLINKMTLTLDYCLENMQKKEDMGQDSLVDCSPCNKKTEREVCSLIEQVPQLLVIQLKRFNTKIDYKTGKTEKKKITMMVELPAETSLKGKDFELFGVVNHYGEIDKGHYTACVKRPTDQQWFLYDDEKVKPIGFKEVNTEGAYILFYVQKPASSN